MNYIILPPTPEEIAEYEMQQKALHDKLDKELEEATKEMLAPLGNAFKEAFSTIELLGMRLRIVEGVDCAKCVFCANKDKHLCKIHFNNKTPCLRYDGTANRHFELIKEGGEE